MSSSIARGASRIRQEGHDGWLVAETLLAGLAVLLVAARIPVGGKLVASDLLSWALLPLWLPVLRRFKGASTLMAVGLGAIVACWMLTRFASVDHHVSMSLCWGIIKLLASTLTSIGLLLWARERLPLHHLFALFGVGLLVAGPSSAALFATNPWKFGFSVPVTIIVVGWVSAKGHARLTVALLVLLAAICMVTDARSNFAVLLLTVGLLLWRLAVQSSRPRDRRSIAGTLLVLVAFATAAYYAVQAAILDGALGEETQRRSQEQLRLTGSLLLGGRPELGASTALFQHRPMGFGGGTFVNTSDLLAAKNGMAALHYDPNNGYVHHFMFGRGIELHSMVFDLWAWCGVMGLLLALVVLTQVLVALGHQLNTTPVQGAVVVFAAVMTLWNLPFAPWLASMPLLVLVLGTGLVRREDPGAPRRGAGEVT